MRHPLSLPDDQADMDYAYSLIDRGLLPDFVLRPAVRALCNSRLREIDNGSLEANHAAKMQFIESLKSRPTAIEQSKANEQHYEVSTAFIMSCLGPHMKYSSCLFPTGKETLEEAEVLMFEDYCKKAKLEDGMDVLDLGCGWGSLTLYLAQKYPQSKINSLSNSHSQKVYIDKTAKERGLKNVTVYTGDVNEYEFDESIRFDRVLSIEMFEHMKNYQNLLEKVNRWLKPNKEAKGSDGALLFVHIFCHKSQPYEFLDSDGWMASYFFSGGTMPSLDLFTYFQRDLQLLHSWYIPGTHYAKTLEAWLVLQDSHRSRWLSPKGMEEMLEGKGGGPKEATAMFNRFRLFFLSCAEFFNLNNGQSWGLGHYLFRKRD